MNQYSAFKVWGDDPERYEIIIDTVARIQPSTLATFQELLTGYVNSTTTNYPGIFGEKSSISLADGACQVLWDKDIEEHLYYFVEPS